MRQAITLHEFSKDAMSILGIVLFSSLGLAVISESYGAVVLVRIAVLFFGVGITGVLALVLGLSLASGKSELSRWRHIRDAYAAVGLGSEVRFEVRYAMRATKRIPSILNFVQNRVCIVRVESAESKCLGCGQVVFERDLLLGEKRRGYYERFTSLRKDRRDAERLHAFDCPKNRE